MLRPSVDRPGAANIKFAELGGVLALGGCVDSCRATSFAYFCSPLITRRNSDVNTQCYNSEYVLQCCVYILRSKTWLKSVSGS